VGWAEPAKPNALGFPQASSLKSQQALQEMTTTFTHGIRFEVAQDVLGALLAHWSAAAVEALDTANSDPGRLAKIEAEQRKLRSLRHDLDPGDLACHRPAYRSQSVIGM
jgi:hypothetical protein